MKTKLFIALTISFILSPILIGCLSSGSSSGESGSSSPAISFSPMNGPVGTLITVSSTSVDLSTLQSVTVGGVSAVVLAQSNSSASILVLPGSTTGKVAVTTSTSTISSADDFDVDTPTTTPVNQQGPKLVGTGGVGGSNQGYAVAVSADGNAVLIGGRADDSNAGAAWVFTRSGTTWSQQGAKLVGTGAVGAAGQGNAVALSADGNTALIAGFQDDSSLGAVWVFARSGATWTQQGSKLVGTGAVGAAGQGFSVALSADGNTALIGGRGDDTNKGAAWVFTRSGTAWTQQGSKLVGTGAVGASSQGFSVALSADGNTALIGGRGDDSNKGAAWVFTRSGSTWTQEGSKLVGTGAVGSAVQGTAVALSADGNTAAIGGRGDNSNAGATWIFTRSGSTWTQEGSKLVGTGAVGTISQQGFWVALSADGNTLISSGYQDDSYLGATWVFTRTSGTWAQYGSKLVGTGAVGASYQGKSVAVSSDGSTTVIGGALDDSNVGATWIFTR